MGALRGLFDSLTSRKVPRYSPYGESPHHPLRQETRGIVADARQIDLCQLNSIAELGQMVPPSSQAQSSVPPTPISPPSPQSQPPVQTTYTARLSVRPTQTTQPAQSNVLPIPITPPSSQAQPPAQMTQTVQSSIPPIPTTPPSQAPIPIPPSQAQPPVPMTHTGPSSVQPVQTTQPVQSGVRPAQTTQPVQSGVRPAHTTQPAQSSVPPIPITQPSLQALSSIPPTQTDQSNVPPAQITSIHPGSSANTPNLHSPSLGHDVPAGSSRAPGQQTAVTGQWILAVLEERDRYTRTTLLAEFRALLSPVLGPPPNEYSPLLTHDRIIEIIQPCLPEQSSSKLYVSLIIPVFNLAL